MTAAEQVWIDNSLARLEELHAQRDQVEAAGQLDRLAEIDEEIVSLTEVLESVADASGPINVAANAPEPSAGDPYAAAPPAPALVPVDYDPFAAPPPNPAAAVPAQQGYGGPSGPMAVDVADDADFSGGSKTPLIVGLLVLLVAGGVGAFFAMSGVSDREAKPAPPQEAKVITATEVPEDTHEINAAKGQDADRTPTADLTASSSKRPSKSNRRNDHGRRKSSNRQGRKGSGGKDRALNLGKSRDPLGGL